MVCIVIVPLIQVVTVVGSETIHFAKSAEFELDLCDQVLGVECPMPEGTDFEGVASWNGIILLISIFFQLVILCLTFLSESAIVAR